MLSKLLLVAALVASTLGAAVHKRCMTEADVQDNMNKWTPNARKYGVGVDSRNCVKAKMLAYIKTCRTEAELGGFMGARTPYCVHKRHFARR